MNRTQSLVYFNKWLHCFTSAGRLITQKLHFIFPCGIFLAFALCFNPWNCQIDWEFYSQSRFPMKYQKTEAVNGLEQESFCAPDFLSSPRATIWYLSASVQLSYLYTSLQICTSQNNILRLLLTCHFPLFSYGFLVCVNKTWDLRPDSSLQSFTTVNIRQD